MTRLIRGMTLRKRLLLVLSLPLLLWALVMLVTFNQASRLEATAREFSEGDLELFRRFNGLYVDLAQGHVHIFSLLEQARDSDSETAEHLYEQITLQVDALDRIGRQLERIDYRRLGLSIGEQAELQVELRKDYRLYREKVIQALRLASVDFAGAYRVMTASDAEFNHLSMEISGLLNKVEGEFVAGFDRLEDSFQASSGAIIALVTAISIVIAIACRLIYRRLSQGIAETLALSEAISRGNLAGVPERYAEDELGHLASHIHRMGNQLDDLHKNLEHKVDARTRELDQLTVQLKREVATRKRAAEDMQRLAETDELTGLYNRRYFINRIEREWQQERRKGRPLSLLLLDIDHFKQINDRYGHQVGDACLKQLATTLCHCARRMTDTVARFGGEEFIVYLPDTSLEDAQTLAQCILTQVAAIRLSPVTEHQQLTVSIGIGGLSDTHPTPDLIIRAADQAMYAAKHAGRNTYRIAENLAAESAPGNGP